MPSDMITKRLSIMDDISEEIKKIKNMIQDTLDNDDDFQELIKSSQEHKERVKQSKDKISNKSAIKDLELKLKEKKQELKEVKEVLSQELADYYRDEGTMEIEDHKGDIKRLKFNVTLTDWKNPWKKIQFSDIINLIWHLEKKEKKNKRKEWLKEPLREKRESLKPLNLFYRLSNE